MARVHISISDSSLPCNVDTSLTFDFSFYSSMCIFVLGLANVSVTHGQKELKFMYLIRQGHPSTVCWVSDEPKHEFLIICTISQLKKL